MLSYTGLRNLLGDLTNNASSANLTLGDKLINNAIREIISGGNWDFLEKTKLAFTVVDYTTGTVNAVTNNSRTITGSGTTWTTAMVGRYIRVASSTTATASGDDVWYPIKSVESATSLTIAEVYNGTTRASPMAGSYIIRELFYDLPADLEKLISVTITVGGTTYTPTEAPSRQYWEKLNQSVVTGNTTEHFFLFNGSISFYPIPSTSYPITYTYKRKAKDLSVADYTTGNIDIITNGSVDVTGAGTPAWTTPMAGRFLRVTESNVAASSGDGFWYEIASRDSATTLTLVKRYNGTSLTTGATAAYTIGQMPILPEEFHDLPVYRGCEIYFTSIQPDVQKAGLYKRLYQEGFARLKSEHGSKSTSPVTDYGVGEITIANPNLQVTL